MFLSTYPFIFLYLLSFNYPPIPFAFHRYLFSSTLNLSLVCFAQDLCQLFNDLCGINEQCNMLWSYFHIVLSYVITYLSYIYLMPIFLTNITKASSYLINFIIQTKCFVSTQSLFMKYVLICLYYPFRLLFNF